MRPLPAEPLADMPPFVRGLAIIRGAAVPVVDLSSLLGDDDARRRGRYVTLRVGARRIALAVEAVIGIRDLDAVALEAMPPLLSAAQAERVSAMGALDGQLLLVLGTARLLSEAQWTLLGAGAS